MKRLLLLLLPISLLVGGILTISVTPQRDFRDVADCFSFNETVSSSVRRVDCSGAEYGFPLSFVYAEPQVSVSTLNEDPSSEIMIGSTSFVRFDIVAFIINLITWSFVAFVLLGTLAKLLKKKAATKNERRHKKTDDESVPPSKQ